MVIMQTEDQSLPFSSHIYPVTVSNRRATHQSNVVSKNKDIPDTVFPKSC